MRIQTLLASSAAAILLAACGGATKSDTETPPTTVTDTSVKEIMPPVAKREEKTIEQVGRTRTDHYFWMKDENWQDGHERSHRFARRRSRISGCGEQLTQKRLWKSRQKRLLTNFSKKCEAA